MNTRLLNIKGTWREVADFARTTKHKEVLKSGFAMAIHTNHRDILELLFNMACDIACEKTQFPPLHNFADYNNLVGIQFALEHGVDVNIKNIHNQTPLDRAKNLCNEEAIELLRIHGAKE